MNKILLITRPRYDECTNYLFYWSNEIIDLAKKKSIQVLDLKRKRANKKEFKSIISKKQPFFVFFNGHGDVDRITGNNDEVLVKAGENEKLLQSKIIYALSCKSAKKLGPKSIKAGAFCFLGYNDDFIFVYDPNKTSEPLRDMLAALFLKPSNRLVTTILKRHPTGEAYKRSKDLFMKNIQGLLTSESSPFSFALPYLMWDLKHFTCLGDKNAFF